jgi:hypothetical protein
MPTIRVETEVYLEDEITRLGKTDLLELRREIDKRLSGRHSTLFGGMEAHGSLPPVDGERVYTALRHLHAGEIEDARWELERAFEQPVSPMFRARRFVSEKAA